MKERERGTDIRTIEIYAPRDIPLIKEGNDIAEIICKTLEEKNLSLKDGDIIVVTSKIVSRAEGRLIETSEIQPSEEAILLAQKTGKDPKRIEIAIKNEVKKPLIARPGLFLTEHRLGFICTDGGIDSSNTAAGEKGKVVSLLPESPDVSAQRIREEVQSKTQKRIAVIIIDTFGRPDRKGSVGMAIGISGINPIYAPSENLDLFGNPRRPEIAVVDEVAAVASSIMGQTNEGLPVAIVRGTRYHPSETATIQDLLYPAEKYIEDAKQIAKNFP